MAKRVAKKTESKRRASKATVRKKSSAASKVKKAAAKPRTAKAAESKSTSTRTTKVAKRSSKSISGKKKTATVKTTARHKKATPKAAKKTAGVRANVNKKTVASDEASSTGKVIPFPSQERPIPKTRLTPKQLDEFRQLLLKKRAELAGDVSHLSREVADRNSQGPNEHTTMPIHMADVGSDNWEKEFTFGLIANEHERIREIDQALGRIKDGTYGVCLATYRRISVSRLRAKPWAKYCIEYARAREEGRAL